LTLLRSDSTSSSLEGISPTLSNPFNEFSLQGIPLISSETSLDSRTQYEKAIEQGKALQARPTNSVPKVAIRRQHQKGRMTIWERIQVLADGDPMVLFQNWGPNLDGASLVTAVIQIEGRDVALYGHDFTVRAGSMDATNGKKLARLIELAGKRKIPLVGLNDSAGAYVPAGVGGLEGYAEAFTALRKISGVVPSIMCMFGFNAGGGSYLPRQGSFIIQPKNTFFGLTGAGVVKSVLGEDVTPDELGGPQVHSQSGVTDFVVEDEVAALQKVKELLRYLPNHSADSPSDRTTSDPSSRPTWGIDQLLRKAFNSPTGFNTPVDVSILIQQICDHGDYLEVQPSRARNTITGFGRMGGHVVGFVANNSAVSSGQIDIEAAFKNARFIRFCNLYNIPVIFMEDTTGFLPGREQETRGIVQAGRAMLDAIIDLRTPRFLLLIRNAFGGAYASFNNYPTGADLVIALPTTRVAVMGPAGVEFVYKKELRALRSSIAQRTQDAYQNLKAQGLNDESAQHEAKEAVHSWVVAQEAELAARYERELMNPNEALSLGSISQIVMPKNVRHVLVNALQFHLRHYKPTALVDVQREFH
jgi:acetyl-CoA carboxylase carboxyltransferase component